MTLISLMAPIKLGGVLGNKKGALFISGTLKKQMNRRSTPFLQQLIVSLRAFPQQLMGEWTFAGTDFPL